MIFVIVADFLSFVLRTTVGFTTCHKCIQPEYLAGTLFPYAINILFVILDIITIKNLYEMQDKITTSQQKRDLIEEGIITPMTTQNLQHSNSSQYTQYRHQHTSQPQQPTMGFYNNPNPVQSQTTNDNTRNEISYFTQNEQSKYLTSDQIYQQHHTSLLGQNTQNYPQKHHDEVFLYH